ncbi:hypothetical protein FPV67DRAFT_1676639 [Lyophyllum atratum]|nr:hypothetical protein FPV67DRAFT_1676639 [Lyophyllum atratum]
MASVFHGIGRQTRSGITYAAWDPVSPTDASFSFEHALLQSIQDERDEIEHLFTDSPLSSAPTSRTASPAPDETPLSSVPTPRDAPASHPSPLPPLPSAAPSIAPSNKLASAAKSSTSKKRKDKKHGHRRRKRQRQSEQGDGAPNSVRPGVRAKFTSSSTPVHTGADPEGFEVASSGFIGIKAANPLRVLSIGELSQLANLRRIPWGGKAPRPLLDCSTRVVGVLAGQPGGESWLAALAQAVGLLEKAQAGGRFSQKHTHHSRGKFPTLASGFAHGGGRTAPCNLKPYNSVNALLLEELMQAPAFGRLAIFASSKFPSPHSQTQANSSYAGVFATWAPKLYAEYAHCMDEVCANDPALKRNWRRSVFAAAVFNLGPQTVCYRHKDFANLPYGWCAVTALGNFNPTLGGHIVLWDLGLMIEFPAGSTILLPSAVVAHSNSTVQPHETRYSFTQYSAGGLFRWVEHGMKGSRDFYAGLSEEDLQEVAKKDEQRWAAAFLCSPPSKN